MFRTESSASQVEEKLEYKFQNRSWLAAALTCKTGLSEGLQDQTVGDNECLEFLGDKLLGLIVGEALFLARTKTTQPSQITRMTSDFVHNTGPLAHIALYLRLGEHLLMGKGDEINGNRNRLKILSDATEAIIAAVYCDSGKSLEVTRETVIRLYKATNKPLPEPSV